MKKIFFKLTMLLFLLGMSVNAAWADDDPMRDFYWARMIAQPSSGTGGKGKVCVTSDLKSFVYEDPAWKSDTSRADGYSEVYIEISAGNLFTVDLHAHALPDEGSYFAGWSFRNGSTDLGVGQYEWEKYELPQYLLPSKKYGFSNIREYEIYATFMPLLIEGYSISGQNTTVSRTCTQTVTFRVTGSLADVNDFEVPSIIKQTGTGTWTVVPNTDELWYAHKPSSSDYVYSDTYGNPNNGPEEKYYAELRVPVTFTADDDNAGEFSATLQLRSKAGKTMNVVLSARTTGGDGQAVRYDKDGVEVGRGDLTDMIAAATATDIVKLNADYASLVPINKNLTFDLNGHTLSNTLTVSGGNVTIGYSAFGGSANALNVTGGKAILNGGTFGTLTIGANATVEQNGATITGSATNNGTLTTTDGVFQSGLTSTKALIANGGTFNGATAIQVTGGTASIKRGTISGTQYGVLTNGGSATIEKLAVVSGGTKALKNESGTLTVNSGKFADPSKFANGKITFKSAYFGDDAAAIASTYEKQQWRNTAGTEFREGYKYFVGDQEAAQAANVSVCRIGKTSYASLEDALAYANNHLSEGVIIFMENDYTLKAGYYTIPANATLVVPMSDEQDATYLIVPRESGSTPTPYAFRTLTLENGVNMNVLGAIELTCSQYCLTGQEAQSIPGGPFGHMILKPGSHITLASGSELRAWGYVTGDGTKDAEGNYLSGEIDARRGSTVREQFQIGDWKGGDISFTMIMPQDPQQMTHLFPVYEYFIQNIESPVKYHPGASLVCATSVDVSFINAFADEIRLIGVETAVPDKWSMFMMDETADAENTWVRKYYDPRKDQQVYEVNNSAQLGSLKIDLGEVPGYFFGLSGKYHIELDSRKFVLPLTSNFKIHLLSGYMEFTQSTSCLPGMEVEVDKEAEISIIPSTDPSTVSGALYLYDADQWSYMNMKLGSYVGKAGNKKYGAIVTYSATLNDQPKVRNVDTPEAIGDAKLIVHGTFRSASGCSVYTTWSKGTGNTEENNPFVINPAGTGGASIVSTNEDAGTFIFDDASPNFDGVHWDDPANFGQLEHLTGFGNSVLVNFDNNNYGVSSYPIQIYTVLEKELYKSNKYTRMYGFELCTPAKLQNGDRTLVETAGSPAGTSYCYMNDRWTTMQVAEDPCFMKEIVGGQTTYYAKPAEYVAVNVTSRVDLGEGVYMFNGNADHTFSDKDGAGRLFILMSDCQWWEVEKKDNLYHCIHPDNDTYYYWDETASAWKEQRFTITWKNWDGTEIKSYTIDVSSGDTIWEDYSVTYGTQAEYLGSNPTRPANIDYTYDFTGWAPALGKVTSDVTYTATYTEQPRKYAIIFTNEGGDEIERHLLTHNEIPVCENVPTRTGHTLQWEPALAAVTGDTTYRATWLEVPPTECEITFVDYDGDTENHLIWRGNVAVGESPVAPAIVDGKPTGGVGKPATDEYTYVFDHWSPAVEEVTQAMTYTAVYREIPKTYTVIFKNENNSVIETNTYHYGETPACSATPVKESDNENDYTFAWYPQIQTVMGNAEYKATFTPVPKKYALTLKCSPSGAATFTGARGDYIYDAAAEVTVTPSDLKYEFKGWSDLASEDPNKKATSRTVTITGDITLVAEFSCSTCDNVTIAWRNYDGSLLKEVSQAKGTATTYTGPMPERATTAAETYTFDGWSVVKDGERVYKNGMTPKAAEGGATYYAHFAPEAIPSLEVSNGVTQLSAPVTYQNLILTSDGVHSGQLLGENYLTLTGNAYFDFKVNTQPRKWYAIAVPWLVDAATGISANGHALTLNSGVYVLTYDGARRAAQGPQKTWTQLSNGDVMQPGILYMVCVMENASSIRFAKKAGADLLTTTTSVSEYPEATDNNGKDASWNGVANPALFHAYVNAGVTYGQVYIPESDSYDPIVLNTTKLVVGQGAYVQVPADKNITVTQGGEFGPSPAPRRMVAENETSNYEVRFAPINQNFEDRVFVQTDDSKTQDVYTVGLDLAKMGVSAKIAQIWIDRYDTKLCLNTMAPVNGEADYPLVLSVPQDGKYTIDILRSTEEQPNELYLTRDGEAIWNLSQNAYTVKLEQGTTARYGLRTIAKAPQVTTDFEPIWVDPEGNAIKAAKVLINNHVFIIRDGKLYTITGSLVR